MRATKIDKLYFNGSITLLQECLKTFLQAVDYPLAKKDIEQALIEEIANSTEPINSKLYEQYRNNLRKAVNSVFYEDSGDGLSDRLRANISRFSAYKAYHATQQIRERIKEDGDIEAGKKVLHAFNRYQAAEYNTTVSRCRTAKQFGEFAQPDNVRLFPNLRWLPSRSATPREEHIPFYNRVWAKDDPFWNANQPGNLWNCKCDWEETDDPCTDGNPTTPIRHNGLEGNPAITGEVFTNHASYIKQTMRKNSKGELEPTELSAKIEKDANVIEKDICLNDKSLKDRLLNKKAECKAIDNEHISVLMNKYGFSEGFGKVTSASFYTYYAKNEVMKKWDEYLSKATWVKRAENNMAHNTGKNKRNSFKRHCDYFDYYRITMPNGETAYINVIHNKDGKYYLWAITTQIPEY